MARTVFLAAAILVFFAIYWGYFMFFELRTNGQSPGKRRASIRVVRDGGGAVAFPDVAIRSLLRIVDGLGMYSVAGASMFFTRKSQRLGDLAAGTVVVSEELGDFSAHSDDKHQLHVDSAIDPHSIAGTRLTAGEFEMLANYRLRRDELTLDARQRVLPKLVAPIFRRLGQPIPSQDIELLALEAEVDALLAGASALPPAEDEPEPEDDS